VTLTVDVQNDSAEPCPDERVLREAVAAALRGAGRTPRAETEVSLRIVDAAESAALNQRYRGKAGPTNVLSFPADLPPGVPLAHLGDIVVCAPVVRDEAREQGKAAEAHWAHMLIHGTLHLVGYDHIAEADARRMEALESRVLADLGWPCPYGRERAAPTAEAL
jgi:probable rRNA maturation factor